MMKIFSIPSALNSLHMKTLYKRIPSSNLMNLLEHNDYLTVHQRIAYRKIMSSARNMESRESPKLVCSYISNNGLQITCRTSQSVSLEWPFSTKETLVYNDLLETGSADCDSSDGESLAPEKVISCKRNWCEVQMKKGEHNGDWTTIYKGYSNKFEIDGLSPDTIFTFRMKTSEDEESVWGTEIVASTDPMPPSTEDLNQAVEMNSEYLVLRILGNNPSSHLKKILGAHDRNGMTPLMVACHNGNVAISEKLINAGCDINGISTGTKRTPLMFACIMGMQTVVKMLDRYKADWNLRDRCGCNAMDYAVNIGNVSIVNIAIARLGIQSIHKVDLSGWTPLMRATIISDKLDMLRFLVSKGANVNCLDQRRNKSVLMAAILSRKLPFVRYLLSKGANPYFENHLEKNCIELARSLEYREILEAIQEKL